MEANFRWIRDYLFISTVMFSSKDDKISPLEEALTTQVVHQLKDKGHSYSTSWGKNEEILSCEVILF